MKLGPGRNNTATWREANGTKLGCHTEPRTVQELDRIRSIRLGCLGPMVRNDSRPGFRYHLKVHSFRTLTVILAWVLLALSFYQDPEILTGAQRLIQRGIEFVGDNIPSPWGPRIEFVFREVGGLIWLQITLLVLALRVALSTLAMVFRGFRRRSRRADEIGA